MIEKVKLYLTFPVKTFILTKVFESTWDLSSAGRASALQAEGHRFEPCRSHFNAYVRVWAFLFKPDASDAMGRISLLNLT